MIKRTDILTVGGSPNIVTSFRKSCTVSTGFAVVYFSTVTVLTFLTADSRTGKAGVTESADSAVVTLRTQANTGVTGSSPLCRYIGGDISGVGNQVGVYDYIPVNSKGLAFR